MKVLMLSIDHTILDTGSTANARLSDYRALVDELKVVLPPVPPRSRYYYLWDGYKECSQILRDWKGNRIVVTSQDGATNILALLLSMRFKFGLEVQIHTDIFSVYFRKESFNNYLRLFGYWLGAKRARSIRVVSKRIARGLMKNWHVLGKKITILPIFVNKERWQESRAGVNLHREYPEFDRIILMASRITVEKNFPLALKAFALVRERYPNTGLVIVGDGPLRQEIKGQNVVVRPWEDNISSLYRSSDIFLLASNYEGYGLTLIEAALSGTPIVTTDVGVVGEIIKAHNALIAPVGDARRLAQHIIFLFQNDKARIMMQERLLKVVNKLPDKETYLKLLKLSWQKC